MHFIIDLVTDVIAGTEFSDLDAMIINENWITNAHKDVQKDIFGTSRYWQRNPDKKRPFYHGTKARDLRRYLRNKWVHWNELHPELLKVFGNSREGVVRYCDSLMKEDLVFQSGRLLTEQIY